VKNSTKESLEWEVLNPKGEVTAVSGDSLFTHTFPDPDVPTKYLIRLRVNTENGCTDTSSPLQERYITIYPSPKVEIEGPDQMCAGYSEILRAVTLRSEFIDYIWSWKDTNDILHTNTGDSLIIFEPGIYMIEATDIALCIAKDTFEVTALRPEFESLTIEDVSCFGGSDGNIWYEAMKNGGTITNEGGGLWYHPDGYTEKCFLTGGLLSYLKAGTYVFRAVNDLGCELYGEVTVKEPTLLEIFGTQYPTTCGLDNGRLRLKATGGTPPYKFTILKQATGEQVASSDTVSNLSAGNYIIKVTDGNGCITTDTIEVIALPIPGIEVNVNEWAKCGEDNGSIRFTPIDAYYPVKIAWEGRPDDSSNAIARLAPGEYKVTMIDANGCEMDTTIIVDVYPMPEITIVKVPETCHREDGSISITVNSGFPHTLTYVWDGRSETTSALTGLKAGTYKVTISDTLCSAERTIVIEHVDGPVATFEVNSYNVASNAVFTLTDISKGTVNTWNWDMGDSSSQTGKIVYHTYDKAGDYRVHLEVIDTNLCTDTLSKTIHVYEQLNVFVPNMFTPNGDGLNDSWKPTMSEYSRDGYMLSIFDRWGERVFFTTDPDMEWDGMLNGKLVASNSIYNYRLIVHDFTGQEYEFFGQITIIR
jgi:gliding motility-associated-like protein